MEIKYGKMLSSGKGFKFNIKKLSMAYNLVKETENKSQSSVSLLDSINHQLELFGAHHISRNGNKIYFENTLLERGFKPTLMGVLSRGSIRIEDNNNKSKIYYECDYTILYDVAFLLFGIVLSILFNPSFEVWCFGGILGFIIRSIVVFTKSNELINQSLFPVA
jgi:hypothetical protein